MTRSLPPAQTHPSSPSPLTLEREPGVGRAISCWISIDRSVRGRVPNTQRALLSCKKRYYNRYECRQPKAFILNLYVLDLEQTMTICTKCFVDNMLRAQPLQCRTGQLLK